jgi:hypothetical protein
VGTKRGMTRITARKAYQGLPKRRRRSNGALIKVKNELAKEKGKLRALRAKEKKGNFVSGSGLKIGASLAIISGGSMAGATDAYMPEIAGISTPILVGAGLVAAGLFLTEKNENISGILGCIGSGMLAASASDMTANFLATGDNATNSGNTI